MNTKQWGKYGRLPSFIVSPLHRRCNCPYCDFYAQGTRRGPGANALGLHSKLQGQVMAHMREKHADQLG